MEVLCFLLAFLWVSRLLRSDAAVPVIVPPFLVPAGLFLGLAIIQLVPLPPSVVHVLSPQIYLTFSENIPRAGALPWLTLSLYPQATLLEVVRLSAYLCVYFLAIQVLNDRRSMIRMTSVLVIAGVCAALVGIFQLIFWNGKLLWFRALSDEGSHPFGSYVNRNHFAGLMEMIIPVAAGYLLYLLPGRRNGEGMKDRVADFFAHRRANVTVLMSAAVVIMLTALFLSLSRGGIIGLSISMLFFGCMLLMRESTRRKGRTIVLLFLVVLFTVGWFGWKPVMERFERIGRSDVSSAQRVHVWKDSLAILRSSPLFGTGLGTFEQIFPRYRTVPGQARWEHAHNDYVEAAVEFGVAGIVLILAVAVSFFGKTYAMLRRRKSLSARLLGIGSVSGVIAIAVHSLTDFNLHVGANGLYFVFLMGFAVAVLHAKTEDEEGGTLLGVREVSVPQQLKMPLLTGVGVILISLCAIPILNLGGEIMYAMAKGPLGESSGLELRGTMLGRAAALSPFDARLPLAEGTIDYTLGRRDEAVRKLSRAVALNPVNSEALQMLGVALGSTGARDSAAKYMKLAVLYDPTSAWIRKNQALWLFSAGDREQGMQEMREAITLDPANTRKYITALVLSKLRPEEVRSTIPEEALALLLYGNYREEKGDEEGALESYLSALSVMKKTGVMRSEAYHRITKLYEKKRLLERALVFYEEGIKNNPSDLGLRSGLAALYEKLAVPYRAKEEYGKILALDPHNEYAMKRMKELGGR
jgi:O-antigen ligase/tetratricopeptide (TPR) repeat protein